MVRRALKMVFGPVLRWLGVITDAGDAHRVPERSPEQLAAEAASRAEAEAYAKNPDDSRAQVLDIDKYMKMSPEELRKQVG